MFQKNLEILKKRFPRVITVFESELGVTQTEIEVSQSKKGPPVARVTRNERRLYLNSPYDPESEAKRWAGKFEIGEERCALLCGAGFFYHLKALLELNCFKKIAIYEPEPLILKSCLENLDLRELLENPKLFLVAGSDHSLNTALLMEFIQYELVNTSGKLEVIALPSYAELYPSELEQFQTAMKELIQVTQINLTTLDSLGKGWIKNAFHLLTTMTDSPVVQHYFGKFKNVPGIIVSAGPSMEKNVHLLNELKEKAVIFCAGSSIRGMKRQNVSPHFLVSIDYGEACTPVYDDLDLTGIDLIYSVRFWHKIVNKFSGRKILMRTDSEYIPEVIFEQNGGYQIGTVVSGFSVSHICLDLAYKFGCNPIILIGQDLAYTSNKRYADGQLESSQKHLDSGVLPPKCFVTKDIYGEDVVTDKELDGFRIIFEKMIERYYQGKAVIINATEAGQPIRGTVNRKLAEVVVEHCQAERQVTKKIDEVYQKALGELKRHQINPQKFCEKLKELMERAILKLAELVEKLQVIRRMNFEDPEFSPNRFDRDIADITAAYDKTLNNNEYHAFLKELQASALSISKARLLELENVKTKEELDQKLQVYLSIINETKNYLGFIVESIDEVYFQATDSMTPAKDSISSELLALELQIKSGHESVEIQKNLEGLKSTTSKDDAWLLYLKGYLTRKLSRRDQAISLLEQAVAVDPNLAKAYFQLFLLYHAKKDFINALKVLGHCRRLGYHHKFCVRMLIKSSYATKDYIKVVNLIAEYLKEYGPSRAARLLRIDCLCRLNLFEEALAAYQTVLSQISISDRVRTNLENLLSQRIQNQYQESYRKNATFFRERQIEMPEYSKIRFKLCSYLTGEYVYDSTSGKLLSGVNQAPPCQISVNEGDVLIVYNTNDTRVFERLVEVFEQTDPKSQAIIGLVPIYVVEQDLEQWGLICQLFDFQLLENWTNLHFYITSSTEEIEKIFLDDKIPFPNVLHGTDPVALEQILTKVKFLKDKRFQTRMFDLRDYYQSFQVENFRKILIVSSKKHDVLNYYGKMLEEYFNRKGFSVILYTEPLPYHRFTVEEDARLLHDFRPDLVIHLFGIQEELEVYRELNIPFISWLLTEKNYLPDLKPVCLNQTVIYTGNLESINTLTQKGYSLEKIRSIPLPVFEEHLSENEPGIFSNGVGIIGDLLDFETILSNLEIIIYEFSRAKSTRLKKHEIVDTLKSIYFWAFSQHNPDRLQGLSIESYYQVLKDNFGRYNLYFEDEQLEILAKYIRRSFEDYLLQRLQIGWIIEGIKDQPIRIYGKGWERDSQYIPYYIKNIEPLLDFMGFKEAILGNGINVILGSRINNKSYMQPEIVYGIAAGGLVITSNFLANDYGSIFPDSLEEKLELYDSKTELLNKVEYYLENREKRYSKIKELQNYIRENLKIDNIFENLTQRYPRNSQ